MELSVLEQVVTTHGPMIRRLDVRQFHRLFELGIVTEGEPLDTDFHAGAAVRVVIGAGQALDVAVADLLP